MTESEAQTIKLFVIFFLGAIGFGLVTNSVGAGLAFFALLVALSTPR